MSTPNKQLIAAIQRIAEGSPLFTEVRGLLKEIQRRGGIEGLSLKIGSDDDSGGDCCTDPNETGEPTDSTAPDISGDAPPNMSGGTPEGWTDCETGQAIQFTPAGFAQAETCKDCEIPDPTWRPDWHWRIFFGSREILGVTAGEVAKKWVDVFYPDQPNETRTLEAYSLGSPQVQADIETYTDATISVRRYFKDTGNVTILTLDVAFEHRSCATYPAEPYCSVTEAPKICGENWESDSTTSYTLANGCIVASSCDTDATEQAKQCNEQIKICDENGNERIIQSIGNGQFILYDESGGHKGGRYNAATGERLEILDPGSNGGYGSIE